MFFHDGRASKMPAIIAGVPQEMVKKLLYPDSTPVDSDRS